MAAKKAMIFGSCPCGDWEFLKPYRAWPQTVIAADGGLRLARAAGFSPDVYIGDGDSGGAAEPGLSCVTLPTEKDVTDLEAAYLWAVEAGFDTLILTGCTGGRLDHHLAALGLLETAARGGVQAAILDRQNRAEFLLPGTYRLENRGYRYFSLIPADRVLEGLSIRGAKYPLENRDVPRGSSLTISNEFRGQEPVELRIRRGGCWLVWANG